MQLQFQSIPFLLLQYDKFKLYLKVKKAILSNFVKRGSSGSRWRYLLKPYGTLMSNRGKDGEWNNDQRSNFSYLRCFRLLIQSNLIVEKNKTKKNLKIFKNEMIVK